MDEEYFRIREAQASWYYSAKSLHAKNEELQKNAKQLEIVHANDIIVVREEGGRLKRKAEEDGALIQELNKKLKKVEQSRDRLKGESLNDKIVIRDMCIVLNESSMPPEKLVGMAEAVRAYNAFLNSICPEGEECI